MSRESGAAEKESVIGILAPNYELRMRNDKGRGVGTRLSTAPPKKALISNLSFTHYKVRKSIPTPCERERERDDKNCRRKDTFSFSPMLQYQIIGRRRKRDKEGIELDGLGGTILIFDAGKFRS